MDGGGGGRVLIWRQAWVGCWDGTEVTSIAQLPRPISDCTEKKEKYSLFTGKRRERDFRDGSDGMDRNG